MAPPNREQLDILFAALSDPTRRRLFERLSDHPGMTTGELAATVGGMTRYAVMKHLEVLRRAALVQTLPESRRRRHYRVERTLEPIRGWLDAQTGQTGPG